MWDVGNSVFRFYFGKSNTAEAAPPAENFGEYIFLHDKQTPICHAIDGDKEILLFGYATDVSADDSAPAIEHLMEAHTIETLLQREHSLGGKYLVFARFDQQYYVLPDATSSIPLFYRFEDGFCCSSDPVQVADGLIPNDVLQAIRRAGDISQAMPCDVTVYSEIRQLLPNHYLSLKERKAIRIVQQPQTLPVLSAEQAAEETLPRLRRLTHFYAQQFPLYCPLTGGRDSRVVLALLMETNPQIACYTMRHPEHNGAEPDLTVPAEIAKAFSLPYCQIQDVAVTEEAHRRLDVIIGEGAYSERTLRLALTVFAHCGDGAVVNGDIIGQIGKCSLHRDIPDIFATSGYFRCKLHNYSRDAKRLLREWLKEINACGETVSPFDLFSVENRLGRWAAQENTVYNAVGQRYINLFNSRSIIYAWTRVSRGQRKDAAIHTALLQRLCPELANMAYETDGVMARIAKSNGLFYWASSYLKYGLEKAKFIFKRGK